nr:hypothetical protein Iba_chr14fCG1340 [Ipomoea batatas]
MSGVQSQGTGFLGPHPEWNRHPPMAGMSEYVLVESPTEDNSCPWFEVLLTKSVRHRASYSIPGFLRIHRKGIGKLQCRRAQPRGFADSILYSLPKNHGQRPQTLESFVSTFECFRDRARSIVFRGSGSEPTGGPVKCFSGSGRRFQISTSCGGSLGTPMVEASRTKINSGSRHLRSSSNGGPSCHIAILSRLYLPLAARGQQSPRNFLRQKRRLPRARDLLRLNVSMSSARNWGHLCRFLGWDTKETLKLSANFLPNSNIGSIMAQNANHGIHHMTAARPSHGDFVVLHGLS